METKTQNEDKKRVQFDFTEASLARLDALAAEAGSPTRADLVRRALSLYDAYVQAKKRKAEFFFHEADGTQSRVIAVF